jgi:hypothetical protein
MGNHVVQYTEQVIHKDIEAEVEYARQGMESFSEFYYRLSYQKAPLELVAEMATIAQLYQQIRDKLAAITDCFPKG